MQLSENDNATVKLDKLEQSIFLVAKQLISRHYLLDTKTLYADCTRTMKDVDRAKIDEAITTLIAKKMLFDGKAVTRENVLENENRAAIFNIIRTDPGIYLYKIMTRMKIDSRTVTWHLRMLQEFAMIRARQIENNTIYFDSGVDQNLEIVFYYLNKKNALEIFKAIMANPGISFVQLLTAVNLPRSTLTRKVKILIDVGLLTGIHDSGQLASITISEQYSNELNNAIKNQG